MNYVKRHFILICYDIYRNSVFIKYNFIVVYTFYIILLIQCLNNINESILFVYLGSDQSGDSGKQAPTATPSQPQQPSSESQQPGGPSIQPVQLSPQQKILIQKLDNDIRRLLHYYHIDDSDLVEVDDGPLHRIVLIHPERPLPPYIQQNKDLLQRLQSIDLIYFLIKGNIIFS